MKFHNNDDLVERFSMVSVRATHLFLRRRS